MESKEACTHSNIHTKQSGKETQHKQKHLGIGRPKSRSKRNTQCVAKEELTQRYKEHTKPTQQMHTPERFYTTHQDIPQSSNTRENIQPHWNNHKQTKNIENIE